MQVLHTPQEAAQWLRSRVTGTLHADSRKLLPGDGFIAWPGAANDARQHVATALASGTKACLVEMEGVDLYGFSVDSVAGYRQLKVASGPIAAAYFGQPTGQLKLLAVTGTNGKTSTVWWLAMALSNLKRVAPIPCVMVGTLGIGRPPATVATGLTTPDPVLLQQTFRDLVENGVKACAIEASSIGLEEHRLDGSDIEVAIFTNLTQDHLDYHGTMVAYWQAKERLFQWPGLRAAVINIDDPHGATLAGTLCGKVTDVWTLSCTGAARLMASNIHYDKQGLSFTVAEEATSIAAGHDECHVVRTRLIGHYNVSNLLGVMAAMRSLGVPLAAVIESCSDLTPVPGRMECVGGAGQPLVAVDYAHTPDALAQALMALRALADQRGGQLWCVFGCGGDRDASKRPIMGAIAARHADSVVVTTDNPRNEKPEVIISQILLGLTGHASVTVEPDRGMAIDQTVAVASARDVLLIAGKGHEAYQETAGKRSPFSDLDHVRHALNRWIAPANQTRTEDE